MNRTESENPIRALKEAVALNEALLASLRRTLSIIDASLERAEARARPPAPPPVPLPKRAGA